MKFRIKSASFEFSPFLDSVSGRQLLTIALVFVLLQTGWAQTPPATLPFPGCGAYNCPPPPPPSAADARPDCLAFIRLADVYLECGHKIQRLTHTQDVASFSISPDGEQLAIIREISDDDRLELISLKNQHVKSTRLHVNGHLETTCGSQLLFESDKREVRVIDLRKGGEVDFDHAKNVRCANDTSLRLMTREGDLNGSDLFLENGGIRRLIGKGVGEFSISPSGMYIAFEDGFRLCGIKVAEIGRDPICLEEFWPAGRMMVSDDGSIIATEQTSEGCPYRWENVPPHVGHGWPCEALFIWRIGDRKDQLIGFLYRDPQLVSADSAAKISASASAQVKPTVVGSR